MSPTSGFSARAPEEANSAVDPVWLSKTVGDIYDCALDPSKWRAAIGAIADRFSYARASICLLEFANPANFVMFDHGYGEEWRRAADSYLDETVAFWGGSERILVLPLDEPVNISDIRPRAEWPQYAFYREFLQPRQMIDGTCAVLLRTPQSLGYLAMDRHATNGAIRQADIDGLRLITPHLRRALTIAKLFELKTVETATFRSVLDAMICAVMVVDGNLGLIDANRSGRALLAAGDLAQSVQGNLMAHSPLADHALRAAVEIAARHEAGLTQHGIGIPLTGRGGATAVAHVLPLKERFAGATVEARAVAAVFVVASDAHAMADFVAARYALTPSESRIVAGLCRGESLRQISTATGITLHTVKTHLQHIFSKVGCKRQAELVALAARCASSGASYPTLESG